MAHLWIPPKIARVRGLIVAQKTLTTSPIIRKAAAEEGLGVLYFEPGLDPFFPYGDLKHPRHEPSSFDTYAGDRGLAFWHFDEEMARAVRRHHRGKFTQPDPAIGEDKHPVAGGPVSIDNRDKANSGRSVAVVAFHGVSGKRCVLPVMTLHCLQSSRGLVLPADAGAAHSPGSQSTHDPLGAR